MICDFFMIDKWLSRSTVFEISVSSSGFLVDSTKLLFFMFILKILYPIDLTVVPCPKLIPLPKDTIYEPNLRKLVIHHKGNRINLRSIKSTSLLTRKVLEENVSISLML